MKKKLLVLSLALMMGAGVAYAGNVELQGKVTAVKGNTVTIEVQKGKASDVSVGDAAEVQVKKEEKKEAHKKGRDMLMGC
jgi:preprotein translocase subunit YajC